VDAAIAQMGEGSIKVGSDCSSESKEVRIWIEVQSPNPVWSEAVDLLSTTPEINKQPDETSKLPPGLTLLMIQTLVEVMQGRLEMVAVSSEETAGQSTTENVTRLQCSMPLATPETVEQALVVG
jgi:hypothetical protein